MSEWTKAWLFWIAVIAVIALIYVVSSLASGNGLT